MTMTIFPPKYQNWLESFLKEHGAVAGTVHLHLRGRLQLAAAVNIPPQVRAVVNRVPRGKGMAGLALERGEPIQTCNLKEPTSPDVQPGAAAVDAKGAVALPVANGEGGVRAVVGLAFADERELDASELEVLTSAAASVPKF